MTTNRYSRPRRLNIPGTGLFWRCRHGYTILSEPCWRCGVFHPIRFVRHLWSELR